MSDISACEALQQIRLSLKIFSICSIVVYPMLFILALILRAWPVGIVTALIGLIGLGGRLYMEVSR